MYTNSMLLKAVGATYELEEVANNYIRNYDRYWLSLRYTRALSKHFCQRGEAEQVGLISCMLHGFARTAGGATESQDNSNNCPLAVAPL